jgi:Protein of unknown function (DUF1559)
VYSEPKTATTDFLKVSLPEAEMESANSPETQSSLAPKSDSPSRKNPLVRILVWAVAAAFVLSALSIGAVFLIQLRVHQNRLESANRLKTIGLTSHFYHDFTKHIPANGTVEIHKWNGQQAGGPADANRQSAGSWAYRLLPVLSLQDARDFVLPFPDLEKTRNLVVVYRCSFRDRVHYAEGEGFNGGPYTDFVLNPFINDTVNGDVDKPNRYATFFGITDGTENTILFGHGWISIDDRLNASPGNGRCSIYLGGTNGTARNGKRLVRDSRGQDHYNDWGSPFADGALICMADASVRFVSYEVNSELFFQFLHPSDGAKPALPPEQKADEQFNPFYSNPIRQ